MKLTPCSAKDCINLTYDTYSKYGTFCFKHSSMTFEPYILTKDDISPLSQRVIIMNNKQKSPTILEVNETSKPAELEIQRLPLPFKEYRHIEVECCMCSDKMSADKKLRCGHIMCDDCIEMTHCEACPACDCKIE